jgi:uncharacterized protein YndB with AHSA1/START domain
MRKLVKLAVLLGAGTLLYARLIRPWVLHWGASEAEVSATLPGDDILPAVDLQTTRAITINAPPEKIWPWLVQMGPRPRAGVYTYDWLERLLGIDIENADRILPEYQHLEVGEFFPLNEKGTNGLHVRRVEPERAIVLQWANEESTWAFVLEPTGDGRTRLISRNRIVGSGPAFRAVMAVMEPASLVMERETLRGIKRRVESSAA